MDPSSLAAQLRCPNGEHGLDVASRMNESNLGINQRCIQLLQFGDGDRVLEIGPGNGAFAAEILGCANDIHYTGLDWSEDMVAEANLRNVELVASKQATFLQGSSDRIPLEAASQHKALSVHTLYFWEQPEKHLAEVRRVCRPNALFCLAFADPTFLKELAFSAFGFALHDTQQATDMLGRAGFELIDSLQHAETALSNTGATVDKRVNILLSRAG